MSPGFSLVLSGDGTFCVVVFTPGSRWSSNSEDRGISFTSSCVVWSALSYCAPALFLGRMKGIHFSRCLLWLQFCLVVWGVVPEQL